MKTYNKWKIEKLLNHNSEIYFTESMLGIRHENESLTELPGRVVYTVTDVDENEGTVVLMNPEGERFKFEQNELSKALAEDAGAEGFQALQYPVGYLLSTSSDALSKLSIFDGRLKKIFKKEKSNKKDPK